MTGSGHYSFRETAPGGAVATLLWLLIVQGFQFYLSIANPGTAYGAASSVLVFLVFLYLTSMGLILGAMVAAVIVRRCRERGMMLCHPARRRTRCRGRRSPASRSRAAQDMSERRSPLWRRILTWVFLILFCLAAPVALVTGWARLTIVDEDVYVRTVSRAAGDPRVQMGVVPDGSHPRRGQAGRGEPDRDRGAAVARRRRGARRGDPGRGRQRRVPPDLGGGQSGGPPFPRLRAGGGTGATGHARFVAPARRNSDRGGSGRRRRSARSGAGCRGPAHRGARRRNGRSRPARPAATRSRLLAPRWPSTVLSLILSVVLAPDRLAAIGRAGFGLAIAMVGLMALMLVIADMADRRGRRGRRWRGGRRDPGRHLSGAARLGHRAGAAGTAPGGTLHRLARVAGERNPAHRWSRGRQGHDLAAGDGPRAVPDPAG